MEKYEWVERFCYGNDITIHLPVTVLCFWNRN
jgi:hypothetical protein